MTIRLCHRSTEAVIGNNESDCVPMTLHLQKQMVHWNGPIRHSLPIIPNVERGRYRWKNESSSFSNEIMGKYV